MQDTASGDFLNVTQAAAFLGLSPGTIRRWAQQGTLNGLKVGTRGDWRFTKEELSRLLSGDKQQFAKIQAFLREHAEGIQARAKQKHLEHLGHDQVRLKYIEKYKGSYADIVNEFANNLENVEKGCELFKDIGRELAKGSLDNDLTLEEAVDGTTFLKQAFWEKLEETKLLYQLSVRDFYLFTNVVATYTDILSSEIAFAYHEYYLQAEARLEQERQELAKKEAHDRAKRLKAEQSLQQSDERYRAFIHNSSEGIWRFELEKPVATTLPPDKQIKQFFKYGYLAECNDTMAQMYGFTKAEEIVGARLGDMLLETEPLNLEYLRRFIQAGYRLTNTPSQEMAKDGSVKFFLNTLVGIVEEGQLVRAWGVQRDITLQKHAEEKLRTSEERLQHLVDAIPHLVWIIEPDGSTSYINERWKEWTGFTLKDLNQEVWQDLVHPEDLEKLRRDWRAAFKACHPFLGEYRLKNHDGHYLWFMEHTVPMLDGQGKASKWIGTLTNIDEQKRLERQKDEFIGIASHELKTPVTSIKAYAQILEQRFQKAEDIRSAELVGKMDAQLNKLTALISDLLDVTKIAGGKLQFHYSYFDLNELVAEIIEEMQRTTTRHRLVAKLAKTKTVYGDRDRIGQVLTNLLANAIKYSPKTSDISIQSNIEKNAVTLSVQDFGIGIPEEKQPYVFERFFRVSTPQQETYPGLGLGLYISSQIIKRHGGEIWVESQENQGSTFCFTLPIKKKSGKRSGD